LPYTPCAACLTACGRRRDNRDMADDEAAGAIQVTVEQVHEALLSLYSPAELARCGLAASLPESRLVTDVVHRAQVVRWLLLDAIEALLSANRMAPSPAAARAYDCLKLRYISGLAIDDVAYELSLSSRQAYRDLRWAEARVVEILRARYRIAGEDSGSSVAADPLAEEIETIERRPERLVLASVVEAALSAVSPIARSRGVTLRLEEPQAETLVTATPGILQEAVIQLLSAAVQCTGGGEIAVHIAVAHGEAALELDLGPVDRLRRPDLLEAALRLADGLSLRHETRSTEGSTCLRLVFPVAERQKVLVVEDKPGACALYQRYMENTELEPLVAASAAAAVETTAAGDVSVVLLDIMMPETSGWTVLQDLKADPRTAAVPVVICSVVADPELGFSLGAADYLTKPVSRADLMDCLRRVLQGRSRA